MAASGGVMLRAIAVGSGWGAHSAMAFAADARVELVAVVGRGSRRTRELAARLNAAEYTDLARCVREQAPQLAAVAAGERVHPAIVAALLEVGCHVLCAHPVAPDAATVTGLAALAAERGLRVATDYSLRLSPGFAAARGMLIDRLGAPLRIAAQAPGRALIIGADLCRELAGPIEAVYAAARYPAGLVRRRAAAPEAFPPTAILEHAGGCVSVLVPMPHADPRAAHQLAISTERGRLDLALPCGAMSLTVARGQGTVQCDRLRESAELEDVTEIFGAPMRRLATRFIDCVVDGAGAVATLADEAHLRAVWHALRRSARTGSPAAVPLAAERGPRA